MQSTSFYLLHKWADSPLRKFLLDRLRFLIGRLVLNNEMKNAEAISDLSTEILTCADRFATTKIDENEFYDYLHELHPKLDKYADEMIKSKKLKMVANEMFQESIDEEGSYYNRPLSSNSERIHYNEHNRDYRPSTYRHIVFIFGLWTEPRKPTRSHVVIMKTEYSNCILSYLNRNNLLSAETEAISIASNTVWAGKRTPLSINGFRRVCTSIHAEYPAIKIRFVGFYSKSTPHLDYFNERLKEFCDSFDYLEYIKFESLFGPNEIPSNLTSMSTVFRIMLERLCEW